MKNDCQALYNSIYNLLESKLDMIKELDNLSAEVDRLARNTESEINWSYLLEDLKQQLDGINIEYALGFIDDIEEEVNDLQFKEQRAIQKMRTQVNPLLKNTPVYFDAAHPPSISDFAEHPLKIKE